VAGRFRDKPALVVSLVIWCGLIAWAFFMRTQTEYWLLGIGVGLVMGGTQAIARSLQSKFTPPSSAGEFFGFYAITGKCASAAGPLMFSLVWAISGNIRWGILSVAILFVVGLILLLPVDEEQGILEAKAEEKRLTGPDGMEPGRSEASVPQ
jgi:UMF1 family MFS transporter